MLGFKLVKLINGVNESKYKTPPCNQWDNDVRIIDTDLQVIMIRDCQSCQKYDDPNYSTPIHFVQVSGTYLPYTTRDLPIAEKYTGNYDGATLIWVKAQIENGRIAHGQRKKIHSLMEALAAPQQEQP